MWTFSQILKWFDLCGPLAEFWLGPLAEFWPNLTYADHQPNFVLIWPMLTLGQILTWYDFRGPLPYFWLDLTYFEACELKKSHKAEKVYNFLDPPPSPRVFWTLLNLGKIGSLTPPPPLGPNLGKIWNWENKDVMQNIRRDITCCFEGTRPLIGCPLYCATNSCPDTLPRYLPPIPRANQRPSSFKAAPQHARHRRRE